MIVGERNGMRIADMRHRVTLRQPVKSMDKARQQIVTYEPELTNQPAKFVQVSGGETVRGRQIEAGVTALFTVNYRPEYTVEKQIFFNGQCYGIVRIDNPDGVKRFADLHCRAVVSG